MNARFQLIVNGKIKTEVVCQYHTSFEAFKGLIPDLDETKDTFEVIRLDSPEGIVLPFKTQSYMQVSHFAIEVHIRNLIETYGVNTVLAVIDKEVGKGRAA